MVSSGRYNPDFDSVLCVPIQELVIDEDLVQGVQVINSSFSVHHETVLVHLDVRRTLSPPKVVLSKIILDDALVPWRATRLGPRKCCQCSGGTDERSFLILNRLFIKFSWGEIVEDMGKFQRTVADNNGGSADMMVHVSNLLGI